MFHKWRVQLLLLSIYNYHNFISIITKKEVEMQDMYANSNEGMVVKLIISVGQVGQKEPLESSPRWELIFSEIFNLNLI